MNTKGIVNEIGFPIIPRQGSLAILIDCWASSDPGPNRLYHNIKTFLEREKFISHIVIASYDDYPTDQRILDINKKQVITQELVDIEALIKNLGIKYVYVFGASWTYCVRHRSTGFLKLNKIPNIKILTVSDCVQDGGENVDFSKESEWIKLRDKVFLYDN